jgi:hypothetical protein
MKADVNRRMRREGEEEDDLVREIDPTGRGL